jgi:hypothetical protein
MKVEVLKTFYHDKLGRVPKGAIVELPDSQAYMFLEKNAVRRYATKVVREVPLENAGVITQSSALPVEEVSPPMTSPKSKRGVKKTKVVEL